jgi:predicted O-linked N-acetylglucosamine transferase (SPINDLY family)
VRDPERKLRIGYVSPDLCAHVVSRFIAPVLARHDRDAFEVYCYAEVAAPDEITTMLRGYANGWRDTVGEPDEHLAEAIRQDGIDILVDLAGHSASNRLLVFARKPAPVQITYLGYAATTGMTAMDYRLTDALADPPGMTEQFHSERLIRLPKCAWCYNKLADGPGVSELPASKAGHVTFCSFNNFAKVNEPLLRLWGRILQSVPGSRLLIKANALDSPSTQQRVRDWASGAGIDQNRLDLCGWLSLAEHYARYGQVDIALDTFPYHGTTMTCEALWMGVPVVTLAGGSHLSRVGVSLLTNVGLPELVAESADDYVRIAADLGGDLSRLRGMRATLRKRMEDSPLLDAAGFTKNLEAAYRQAWRQWCNAGKTD